jgi:ATP phosphoribosyltransferase
VLDLLAEAGITVRFGGRGYRPSVGLEAVGAKLLKPQNVVRMLAGGSRDLGFAGADWVAELDLELVELLDTGLDPVRLVAAAPADLVRAGWPRPQMVVASEYAQLTRRWLDRVAPDATVVRSYGATEVFPPEDADCIVDNTATGATLRANGLVVVDTLMTSTTRLYANPAVLADPARRARVEDLVLVLQAVLDARRSVLVEVNVPSSGLDRMVALLPCLREPTISRLAGDGYALKVAAPRSALPTLIPRIRAAGGTDIVVTRPEQVVR